MKRLLLVLCCVLAACAEAAPGGEQPAAPAGDWANRLDVREVRAIQVAIGKGVKDSEYRARTRRFDVESPRCSAPYPLISETLYVDARDRPVLYHVEQLSFDDEKVTYDRYYDANGKLRFFFLDRVLSSVRVYFYRNGKEFLTVNKDRDEVTILENGSWETDPNTASGAQEFFRERQACPEVKKSSSPARGPGAPPARALRTH